MSKGIGRIRSCSDFMCKRSRSSKCLGAKDCSSCFLESKCSSCIHAVEVTSRPYASYQCEKGHDKKRN